MKKNFGIAKLGFMGKLAAALVAGVMVACPALAQDVSSWAAIRNAVDDMGNNAQLTLRLTENVTANSQLSISNNKDVTLDLNGYTITRTYNDGAMINMTGASKLTIDDSKNAKVTEAKYTRSKTRFDMTDGSAENGTGIALGSSFDANTRTLTWYETRSMVSSANRAMTVETDYVRTASGVGGINGNAIARPLIYIDCWNNNTHPTLTIKDGMLYNSARRAIFMNGRGTINIEGGYIFNNWTNGDGDRGGAIRINANGKQHAILNISGGVIAGNKALAGGAIVSEGDNGATINMTGGVLSGNASTYSGYNNQDGGGAIYIGRNNVMNLSGGLITNNWCVANRSKQDNYDNTGGGILTYGQVKMTGGQITSNEAAGGGAMGTGPWNGGEIIIKNGIIAGNYARQNEGGGVTINGSGEGNITGGHITNNVCETNHHWGGGGLFMADGSMTIVEALVVTENSAGGFGGGGAGCPTGRLDTHAIDLSNHGIAMFDNTAAGTTLSGSGSTKPEDHRYAEIDEVFTRENGAYYQDYFSALSSVFCCGMLGGTSDNPNKANWIGTVDGAVFDCKDHSHPVGDDWRQSSQFITGLTAFPSNGDKAEAIEAGRVFLTGNHSNTHGGGFLCDGYLLVDTDKRETEVGDRMDISGTKVLENGTLGSSKFEFEVTDVTNPNNKILYTVGSNAEDGKITFIKRLKFDRAGNYTFEVREKHGSAGSGFKYSDEMYVIDVKVGDVTSYRDYVDEDGDVHTGNNGIKVVFHQIQHVTVTYVPDFNNPTKNTDEIFDSNVSSSDNSIFHLDTDLKFINRVEDSGSLTVSKTLVSDAAADKDQVFSFQVVLSDTSISGTYGEMTFNHGVASFTLKGGESKTAVSLPAGVSYTVTESATNGFATGFTGATGTIQKGQHAQAVFTNTRHTGGLTVTKKVVGNIIDQLKSFDFKVTLSDTTINGKYGDMTFTNGVAEFSLRHNQSKTATGLPSGIGYEVEETDDNGYTTTHSGKTGTIPANDTITVEFTNTRKTGNLKVTKTVKGIGSDKTKAFNFTVVLSDSSISGTFGDMTFTDGVATFTLTDGQSKTASGLPTGVQYTVSEQTDGGFTTTSEGTTGTITENRTAVSEFVNTRKLGGLTVSKTVVGTQKDKTTPFHFTVTLSDSSLTGTFGDMTFTNGVATFTLMDGQSKTASGLPTGVRYTYTVAETPDSGFITTSTGATGTIEENKSAVSEFVNTRKVGDLAVRKLVTGNDSDTNKQFQFTVVLSDNTVSGEHGDMTFTNGQATFTLKHGETKTAKGLPHGATYTVTEVSDGYVVKTENATGMISANDTITATFTNDKSRDLVGGLKISKKVTGNAGDKTKAFAFQVTLDQQISGIYGDLVFENGVASFSLKHDESRIASNLPAGAKYTVVELLDDKSYIVTATGHVGTIVDQLIAEAVFTNDKNVEEKFGDLQVQKFIKGNAADTTKKFTFRVTLSDKTINGVYGQMTFENGVATFKLGDQETKVAKKLPAGISYTVAELDSEDYKVEATNDIGTVPANNRVEIVFVNGRDWYEMPETGDNSSMPLYIALMAVSCIMMAIMMIGKRRA